MISLVTTHFEEADQADKELILSIYSKMLLVAVVAVDLVVYLKIFFGGGGTSNHSEGTRGSDLRVSVEIYSGASRHWS